MPPSDHYATLGLTPRATQEQIKNAYRQLARKLHPDLNKAPDATSRFSAIQHAYEVLADPMQRAEYDTKRDYDASGHGMPESVGRGAGPLFVVEHCRCQVVGRGHAERL